MPAPPDDVRAKLPSVVAWVSDALRAHQARARPVAWCGFARLGHYFSPQLLAQAKVIAVDVPPTPPLTRLGLPEFAAFEQMAPLGITYLDTFFIRSGEEHNESLHFHELIHVVQWQLLGTEGFFLAYAAGLVDAGYRNSPLEEMAYEAQARFEAGEIFDAEQYVGVELRSRFSWQLSPQPRRSA